MKVWKRVQNKRIHKINNEIRALKVRLTGLKGEKLGIVSINEALRQSKIFGSDLVEISPNSEPPVCKIMNYGKFIYNKTKALKEQRKKQKIIQIKEIKFRPNTDEGDYQVKLRNLIRFLKEGNKVKITLRFRGREMTHKEIGVNVLNRLKKDLNHISILEFFPSKIEGRQMVMILSPKK
ncbi:MAG: translation initiation factor IF-3 [Buchnera aphidicola (Periphyllus lyropictus)]|uniref:translation initiation factor IF-3 n=1 Tax=Buchnera aphidicola TaxID=9 RepID=UPI001EB6013E|nr:translation initiation factor IF-3 [Buchnera aphidicola]NIH16711.1 translation initiation factor IF-3 [Buchnera aphidicola (Periphyllus lyropictus)]USS94834.1 translation initiation factor IF-3 [Buchnera aphidicola (Periphyllus lyropictus)]